MSVAINMPEMSANGLSENWLFKHCGHLHWQRLCESLGVASARLRDETGARLYPTFVAVRARYEEPLSAVKENDCFDADVSLSHFGRSFFLSQVSLRGRALVLRLEMLTAFAAREAEARNDLRKSAPAGEIAGTCATLSEAPPILTLAQGMRRSETDAHSFSGQLLNLRGESLDLACDYDPSPYSDYNGANLLYFASYPTICDTLERRLIGRAGLLSGATDWALATSTLARDVFYYRNLDLGETLQGRLRRFVPGPDRVILHTTLIRKRDGLPLADLFTQKALVS